MINKRSILLGITLIALLLAAVAIATAASPVSTPEELGSLLYFDENLSEPAGQSCASCHDPAFGFVDPDSNLPVSEGVIPGLFGGRNSPSSAYAMYAPTRYFDTDEGLWIGGQFWDSRATGEALGDPLADQAVGPFLNPVEMANPDSTCVVYKVCTGSYGSSFTNVWGANACTINWPVDVATSCADGLVIDLDDVDRTNSDAAYDNIGRSIAAFERTQLFAPFSSQYDAYLQACLANGGQQDDCAKGVGRIAAKVGKKFFNKEEWYGFQLFVNENNNDGILDKGEGAMCAACHVADWTAVADYALTVQAPAWAPSGFVPPLFTDFTYDNLGVPQNTEFPLDPDSPPDLGLGAIVGDPAENGKFKVMTLRNVGLTEPYAHNGYFKTLKEITHFYNTRDVPGSLQKGADWPPPEYPDTKNVTELGNLGLSDADEDALVEFMKTLNDGYRP